MPRAALGTPTHKAHPDAGGGEFDQGEAVGVVLSKRVARPGMLELVEEVLDEIAVAVEPRLNGGRRPEHIGCSAPAAFADLASPCKGGDWASLMRMDTVTHRYD